MGNGRRLQSRGAGTPRFAVGLAALGMMAGGLAACVPVTEIVALSWDDHPDANPGDGVCATPTSTPVCTLRAAVMEANALGTPVRISAAPQLITRLGARR